MTDPLSYDLRFDEPWHAKVFALTVALNEAGHLPWHDWTEAFGATLARHRLERELNGGEDYFRAWLETLETVLDRRGAIAAKQAETMQRRWREAYLSTPHGAPVQLRD